MCASATDSAFTSELTAVAIERSDAGKRGDFASVERAEFWEVAEEGAGDGVADTWHGGKDVAFVPPVVVLFDGSIDYLIECLELCSEGIDDAVDAHKSLML